MSQSEKARVSRRRGWVWLIVLLAVAAGMYFYLNRSDTANQSGLPGMRGMRDMAVPVRTATATESSVQVVLPAVGTVTALNTVTVTSRVEGELEAVLFAEGQKVQAGDMLARIDPRPYQVALDQALGQQAQNQALLENAQRDLRRYEQLFKQNSLARQQLDTQRALVQQYQGALVSDQAEVDNARLQLEFAQIKAPISGRVGLRKVDPGNLISAGDTEGLVVITQTQPISVLFSLPQAQLPEVRAQLMNGNTLTTVLYDSTSTRELARGELVSIDNQIDVATGTVRMKAQFPNEDEALFPNQFVNVRLVVNTLENALVIPARAVQQGSIGSFVYRVQEDNTVKVQPIVTGAVQERNVTVLEGLQRGQVVVTEGVDRLRDGAKVEIVEE
ncbi:MdtA/MuxA family multidrug efflux RND transporter periplasmic adaptor subunit [Pusillimonas sp. DMV24BSW_D]|uniref:MdtA/MuxA family multidrug efflux RND transporter periplasmic adaptor subunit n=1 Tax=Neopusillimonas aestuarii TaxID=2716226 RepID=UPI001407AC30|nr:MdtA/MuxA family multidrug efflux RND transporter periplasmic adaptor subunit [Pusillimonas sp. DMV24BSW_D]QIM48703.1 MdtA/MuxA family multidrug efflux RND transporter periplasmic adaptor subunit [Pusillimonas sp. DMV24BSW_D]